jgi:tRNA G18 (ribose-2'-O)-methylase SpoU
VPVVAIAEADDPRVDDYRAIREPDLVRRRGLFVAEGRLVVARLVALPRYAIRSILASESGLAALREAAGDALARRPGLPVYVAPPAVIEAVGGFDFHRGCLALAERPPAADAADILAAAAPGRPIVIVEGVAQADNVGSIFRNAHAFGAAGVLLDPATVDPLYRKALRTAMGATLVVPWARLEPWPGALERVRRAGCVLAALTPRPPTVDLDAFARGHRARPVALLIGSEGSGLGAATMAAADARIGIAMAPGADSVNVATASGIALHILSRQDCNRFEP